MSLNSKCCPLKLMSKHMTQSNPNNGSAVESIKINLQIYIRTEEGGLIIQKLVLPVGTVPFQDPLKPHQNILIFPEVSRFPLL